ncbi:hypothetical protein SAMN06295974_3133 [Plantibacter flavus]|uniref:DUF6571 domain-containing protein n=1 Tax=Plantibacter flavus TaxID=150123 RepID=A0A3N2C483_9MICO|nr:DUF6571 family protein [Plantibacter flavus]ROR82240.1 hypothetical protein EDD42_2328 [Plantibacter flavus]SMG42609.1 hypothetical protein SAMN06295974_3133 [Plantibacter flavus]
MSNWTPDDPGAGDLAELETMRDGLAATTTTAQDLRQSLAQSQTSAQAAWSGDAATMWAAGVSAEISRLEQIATSSDAARSALADHIEAVASIAERAQTQRDTITDLTTEAQRAGFIVQAVRTSSVPGSVTCTLPSGMSPPSRSYRDKASAFETDINAAAGIIASLAEERTSADTTLATTVSAAIEGWAQEAAHYRSIGITDPKDMLPSRLMPALIDYTRDLTTQDGDLTPEQVSALSFFLQQNASDAAAMSYYFNALGGDTTGDLVDTLNDLLTSTGRNTKDLPNDAVMSLATLIRQGLATGSARWNEGAGERFATELLENDHRGAAAFLFTGPPYLGPTVASAAAVHVDQYERVNGTRAPHWSYTLLAYGGNSDTDSGYDLAGRIFETLGQYPDAALAFIADREVTKIPDPDHPGSRKTSTTGADRVAYWFGERDWSLEDHFTGPAALLEGAQRADGGRLAPPLTLDTNDLVSALIAQAANALTSNPSFTSEHLSDDAALSLAQSLLPYLNDLTFFPLTEFTQRSTDSLLGEKGEYRRPVIEKDVLAGLIGALAGHEDAATLLVDAVEFLATGEIAQALQSTDIDTIKDAYARAAAITGLLRGSTLGETIRSATAIVERGQHERDTLAAALGIVPLPGGPAVSVIASILRGEAFNGLDEASVEGLRKLVESNKSSRDPLSASFQVELTAAELQRHGIPCPQPPSWSDLGTDDLETRAQDFTDAVKDWLQTTERSLPDGTVRGIHQATGTYRDQLDLALNAASEDE